MEENVNNTIDTNEDLVKCTICGNWHHLEDVTEVEDNVYICNECGAENYVKCDDCGDWYDYNYTYTTYDGRTICEDCFNDHYIQCSDCDDIYPTDLSYTTENGYDICENCFNDNYFTCYECGEIFNINDSYEHDGFLYCQNCYEEIEENEEDICDEDLFHDYGYKPELKTYYTKKDVEEFVEFFNTNYGANIMTAELVENDPQYHEIFLNQLLKIGFELETERNDSNFSQKEFCGIMHKIFGDFVYYKYDGSLEYGVEMVSHAFTLNWLRDNETMIQTALNKAREIGFISHKYGRCGLHFHINRQYYMRNLLFSKDGDNYAEFTYGDKRDYTNNIANKLNLFFETYKDQIKTFSRREDFHYCNFLSTSYVSTSNNYNLDTNVLNYYKNEDRRLVVNNQNKSTIEIRVMRGTLIFETFMASCEFIFNLAKLVENTTSKISWSKVVNDKSSKYIRNYCLTRDIKNVRKYLKDYAKINENDFKLSANKLKDTFAELEPTLLNFGDIALDYSKNIEVDLVKEYNKNATMKEGSNIREMREFLYSQLNKMDNIRDKVEPLQSLTKLVQGVKSRFETNDFDTYYLSVICDRLRTMRVENLINDDQLNEIASKCDDIRGYARTNSNYGKYLQYGHNA